MEQIMNFETPKEYAKKWQKAEMQFVKEIKETELEFVHKTRINYLIEQCVEYKVRIDIAKFQWEKDLKTASVMERLVNWYLADVSAMQKKLLRYWKELEALLRCEEWNDNVTSEMIERARQADIRDFVETNKRRFARCVNPEHEDRNPSMYIKNGFAYCFSCGWSGDVIDIVMNKYDIKFLEAVKMIVRASTEPK